MLLRGVGTTRYSFLPDASVQWQPDGLTIHSKKRFPGAGFLGAPPISPTFAFSDTHTHTPTYLMLSYVLSVFCSNSYDFNLLSFMFFCFIYFVFRHTTHGGDGRLRQIGKSGGSRRESRNLQRVRFSSYQT